MKTVIKIVTMIGLIAMASILFSLSIDGFLNMAKLIFHCESGYQFSDTDVFVLVSSSACMIVSMVFTKASGAILKELLDI